MTAGDDVRWVQTVGSPGPGDPRDGELHQLLGDLPEQFDLEPWEEQDDAADARYIRRDSPPILDANGREVWLYDYQPPDQP